MVTVRKLNRILDKSIKIKLIFLVIAIIIGSLIETFSLAMITPFITVLLDNSAIQTNQYISLIYRLLNFQSVSSFLAFLTFTLSAVYIFRGLYLFLLNRLKIRAISKNQAIYSKRLLVKILGFSYLYHTHKNITEIQNIVNVDVGETFGMLKSILQLLADLFMTLFMLAYLFYESPIMTLCVLGLVLICVVLYFLIFRRSIRRTGIVNRETWIQVNKAIYQLFGGIKEIKVSKREKYFEKAFKTVRDEHVRASVLYKTLELLPIYSVEIICFGGAFALLGLFIIGGADITAIVPQLSLFVLAALRILPAVTKQVNGVSLIMYRRASVDALYKSLFEEKDIASALTAHTAVQDSSDGTATDDIHVCGVSFKYPGIDEQVLENVSFTIPEKKSVALIGPSGAGKTTLADLILGVLTPDSGTVLYRGQPVYDNNSWSRSIGYIPQNIYLLDESILANVAFGISAKDIDEEKIWKALEQAQLKAFVESLPEGLNSIVGDRGIRLSGGQRQRIGIARAIYDDPPILVLDEATSSLDYETEKAVMDAIIGFHGNKTILIVAHRLSTIEHCDIVYRVENKTVARER